jgi:hypothetical protein
MSSFSLRPLGPLADLREEERLACFFENGLISPAAPVSTFLVAAILPATAYDYKTLTLQALGIRSHYSNQIEFGSPHEACSRGFLLGTLYNNLRHLERKGLGCLI